jgi:hypothetical protein
MLERNCTVLILYCSSGRGPSVEFREDSLPEYELGSRDIELRESPEVVLDRIIEMMARKELD